MNEETIIPSCVKKFLLVAKFFGIFGPTVIGERSRRSSPAGKLYSLVWLVVAFVYLGYIEMGTIDIISIVIALKNKPGKFVLVTGEIWIAIFRQSDIIKFFVKLNDHDRRLKNLRFVRKDGTTIYWIITSIPAFVFACEQFWKFFYEKTSIKTIFHDFFDNIYDLFRYFVVMKFCIFVNLIYRRFVFLNERVTKKVNPRSVMYRDGLLTIYDVRYLHAKLCEAGDALNDVYGLWVLVWCVEVAMIVSRTVGIFLQTGIVPIGTANVVVWLIGLCWNCGIASEEANRTNRKLLEATPLSGDSADIVDRTEVAMYLSSHEFNFSAVHMFTINRPFLLQMVGILLTYVTFIFG